MLPLCAYCSLHSRDRGIPQQPRSDHRITAQNSIPASAPGSQSKRQVPHRGQICAPSTHLPICDLSSAWHSLYRTWANFWDCSATCKGHFCRWTLRGLVQGPARLFSRAVSGSFPHSLSLWSKPSLPVGTPSSHSPASLQSQTPSTHVPSCSSTSTKHLCKYVNI